MNGGSDPAQNDFVSGMESVLCGNEMALAYPRGRHAAFASNPAKVTVVVPVFNGGSRLKRCLQSITEQTCADYQVLVIDNGSTDESLVIALQFADANPKFLVYQNAANLGRIGNWNRALELARGQYVKPVMVNDYLLPACLEQLAETLDQHPEVAMARCSVTTRDKDKWYFGPLFNQSRKLTGLEAIEYGVTAGNPAAGPSAQMFRRSVYLQRDIRFDAALDWAADFDFAMRLFETGGLYYLRSSLFVFELTNRFATNASKIRTFHDEIEVIGRAVERNAARLSPACKASALEKAESLYRNFTMQSCTAEEHLQGDEIWQNARNKYKSLFKEFDPAEIASEALAQPSMEQAARARALFQSGFTGSPETASMALN